ncbi:MAG: hypothetical protein ACRENU_06630 [Gemmatimonadaceae bacterium]
MQRSNVLALLALSATLQAQVPQVDTARLDARLVAGARVRVGMTDSGRVIESRVVVATRDTIEIIDDASQGRRLAFHDLGLLEVRYRDRSLGMFLGTLGFVCGAAMYLKWCAQNPQECRCLETREEDDDDDDDGSTLFGVALVSAFLGSMIGHALTEPEWKLISLPMRIGLTPVRGGIGVYASLSFR